MHLLAFMSGLQYLVLHSTNNLSINQSTFVYHALTRQVSMKAGHDIFLEVFL